MRYTLPQPYRDLAHTADVGVAVEGSSAEEAREERLSAVGDGRAAVAIALLRELLFRFATERLVPGACEVARLDERGAEIAVAFGRHHPDRHAEGLDLKAVTWHAARFEEAGGVWRAQVVFDI